MIARVWKGKTLDKDGDAYMDYLQATGIKDYRSIDGNRGVLVLRRSTSGETEFVLVSLWESMESIQRFTGEDAEKAVYYPEDDAFLLDHQPKVEHYDLTIFE